MKDPEDLESHRLDVTLFYFHFHFAEPLRIDPLATEALNSPDSSIHPWLFTNDPELINPQCFRINPF